MREKHLTYIEEDARIDFRFIVEQGKIRHFSINVSIIIESKNIDVYRVDTAHKGLHEQRFWINLKPKYLEKEKKDDYTTVFNQKKQAVLENFKKWVYLFKSKFVE